MVYCSYIPLSWTVVPKKGESKQALLLFYDLKNHKQVQVDDRIYYNALTACSHSGLVDDETKK